MTGGDIERKAPWSTGLVVVLSGPSGVGKDTLAERLVKRPDIVRAVTATTRARKPGEEQGVNYLFLTREEFCKKVDAGVFLEYAEVFGHFYGTPFDAVHSHIRQGKTVLLVIDVQGARQVRRAALPSAFIFVAPPDRETLAARLRTRGREDEEEIARRLAEADRELAARDQFDTVVVNDDVDRAVAEIEHVIDDYKRLRQDTPPGGAPGC